MKPQASLRALGGANEKNAKKDFKKSPNKRSSSKKKGSNMATRGRSSQCEK